MKSFYVFLVLIVSTTICLSQEDQQVFAKIDSLHNISASQRGDAALVTIQEAEGLLATLKASSNKTSRQHINAFNFYLYYRDSGNEKVSDSLLNVLESQVSPSDTLMFNILAYKGTTLQKKSDLKNALATYTRYMELAKKRDEAIWIGRAHYFFGSYYTDANNLEKTMYHRKKAALIFEEIPEAKGDHADVLFVMAPTYAGMRKIDSAIIIMRKALEIDKKGILEKYGARVYNNLSLMHFYDRNADSAQYYASKYIELSKRKGDSIWIYQGYNNKAKFAHATGSLEAARKYLDTATAFFLPITKSRTLYNVRQFYSNKLDVETNNNTRITSTFRQYDSIVSAKYEDKINREIDELKTSFDRESALEKNQEKLKKQQYLLFGIALGLLLISVIGFLTYRNRRQKLKLEKLEVEQRLFRGQMNPHFVFNSLASLNQMIESNDTKKAQEYLNMFSKLMRGNLEMTSENFISLTEEVDFIKNYLEMQKSINPTLFTYNIDVDVTSQEVLIPPFLLQPFVENAIKHGFKELENSGELTVKIKQVKDFLAIDITDNGKGLAHEGTEPKSYSTEITRKRLKGLDRFSKKKSQLSINPLENNKGTHVKLVIPFMED